MRCILTVKSPSLNSSAVHLLCLSHITPPVAEAASLLAETLHTEGVITLLEQKLFDHSEKVVCICSLHCQRQHRFPAEHFNSIYILKHFLYVK